MVSLVAKPLAENPKIPDLSATLAGERFSYLYRNFRQMPVVDYLVAAEWVASYSNGRACD